MTPGGAGLSGAGFEERFAVHLEVVGGNRVCAAWGHAAYTGHLHPF